jgi:hypothetical protein
MLITISPESRLPSPESPVLGYHSATMPSGIAPAVSVPSLRSTIDTKATLVIESPADPRLDADPPRGELTFGLFALVRRIMFWVKRGEPQEISVPDTDGANPLTQTERADLRAADFQMLDRFPAKAGVSVQAVPIEFTQTTKPSGPAMTCVRSLVSGRKKTSWNSGLFRSSRMRSSSAATFASAIRGATLYEIVDVRLGRRRPSGPSKPPLDS